MKRKFPTTLVFAAIVVALAAFTLWDFKRSKQREDLGENEIKILSLASDQVTGFSIRAKDQTIEVKKVDGEWKMLQPKQDDADETSVSGFINTIVEAKAQNVNDENSKAAVDWKQYGLDPGIGIEVVAGEKRESFQVSLKSAFDGSFYIRKGGQLLLGDRSWAHIADRQASSLRSHQIWRAEGEIKSIKLHLESAGKGQNISLSKGEQGWKIDPAFDLPVSSSKIAEWINAVRVLRVSEFVAEKPTAKDLEKFLLKKPSMTAEFKVAKEGKENLVHWEIGQEQSDVMFIHSDRSDEVYKVGKFAMRDIVGSAEMFLDVTGAVKFPVDEATTVEVSRGGKELKFTRGETGWNQGDTPANTELVGEFLQKVRNLDPIAGELPAKLPFGSDHLTVRGKDKILLEMHWTAAKDQLVWLRIGSLKERFKIRATTFNPILQFDFAPKKDPVPIKGAHVQN